MSTLTEFETSVGTYFCIILVIKKKMYCVIFLIRNDLLSFISKSSIIRSNVNMNYIRYSF